MSVVHMENFRPNFKYIKWVRNLDFKMFSVYENFS